MSTQTHLHSFESDETNEGIPNMSFHSCYRCGDHVTRARWALGYRLCLFCGDEAASSDREHWTVLTPHKQGAMFFTPEFAREAAVGINNKGGQVK